MVILGVGDGPLGWPQEIIPWADYNGATRSKLSSEKCTAIIIALLRAANIDETTHIQSDDIAANIDETTRIQSDDDNNNMWEKNVYTVV